MTSQFIRCSGVVLLTLIQMMSNRTLLAEDNAKIITRCKKATALVDLGPAGSGTAFCIDTKGVFVTNHHVVDSVGLNGVVKLVLEPAEESERSVNARVIGWSEEHDLALLLAQDVKGMVALDIASSKKVSEVDTVTAYGFPFGKRLAQSAGDYPAISVNTGKVTALRKRGRELQSIQIDAGVNPGNSGGPLVNEAGNVIGVIVSGNQAARIANAVPSDFVSSLLERPALVFKQPTISFARRTEMQSFAVEVLELSKNTSADTVELQISNDRDPIRKASAKVVNGVATIDACPIDPQVSPLKLRLTSRFGDSWRQLDLADISIQVGRHQFRLAEIRKIEQRDKFQIVTCTSGRKLGGQVTGLQDLKWNDGTPFDLAKEVCIDVHAINPGPLVVQLDFTAQRAGKGVSEFSQRIELQDPPQPIPDHPNDPSDPFSPILDEILIEARIGGVDELVVTPDGLFWRHKKFEKPGETDGTETYVTVNGHRWNLKWHTTVQIDPREDTSAAYPLRLGYELWDFELISIKGDKNAAHDPARGTANVREEETNYVVEFNDTADGTSIYQFRLKKKYHRRPPHLGAYQPIRQDSSPSVDLPVTTSIDVLSFVKLPDEILEGNFKRVEASLICDQSAVSRVMLPVLVRGGYEFQFEFTRLAGNEQILLTIPVGEEACMFVLGKEFHGLMQIDGHLVNDLPKESGAVSRTGPLTNGRRYRLKLKVSDVENDTVTVTADLDDERIVNWTGRPGQLRNSVWHATPIFQAFTVRAWGTVLQIHTVELKAGAKSKVCRLGGDWKNSVTPVVDGPPQNIEAKCQTWNNRKYYASDAPMNLVDAQRLAVQLGGRLATISSVEEEEFVKKQFAGNYLWVAGWRKPASALWRDERNRRLVYLPAWAEGQPNLKGGEEFLVYCTILASGGHQPGLHDSHPEASFLRALIEWGEE